MAGDDLLDSYQKLTHSIVNLVNAPRQTGGKVRDAAAPKKVRQAFREAVAQAARRGLTTGLLGEASQRLSAGMLLTTSLNGLSADLEDDQLVVCSFNESWQLDKEKLPRRIEWHRRVYEGTDAQAILLCQPPLATAYAYRQRLPTGELLSGIAELLGGVALCEADAETLQTTAVDHACLLIPGSGLLTHAPDLATCVARAETLERWCAIDHALQP